MDCSFAVLRVIFISVFYSSFIYYPTADKEFLFKKGNLWERQKDVGYQGESREGLGWIETEDGKAARACDVNKGSIFRDNWFYLEDFNVENVNRVFVEVDFEITEWVENCQSCCLNLQSRMASDDDLLKKKYTMSVIATKKTQRKITLIHIDIKSDQRLLNLAVQAKGVCTVVYNISVYYFYCPKNVSTSVQLPRTPAPRKGSEPVHGRCVKGSSGGKRSMTANCNSNGTWQSFSPQENLCKCAKGEEFHNKTGCTPCQKNYYKKVDDVGPCKQCPVNAVSANGSSSCSCKEHFYRNKEGEPCRKIPSKPKNLQHTKLRNGKIRLHWDKPSDSDDHKDIHYRLLVKCLSCGNRSLNQEFMYANITRTSYTVSRLLNNNTYEIIVTALNGVSSKAKKSELQLARITVQLKGVPQVTTAGSAAGSPTGFTAGGMTEQPKSVTSDMTSASDRVEHRSQQEDKPALLAPYIGGAIAVILLLLVICLIVLYYRSKRMKKGNLEEELPLNGPERSYIDPAKYGNPEKAVKVFAKEIDRRQVKLEGVIGEGEFAKVHKGQLCRPNEPPIAVAVKVLKPGSVTKNREDFLTEAAVMGQFKDMNIVALEGVVTISHPVMIITEFMHNGALNRFLTEHRRSLEEAQLLMMARGVASGMKYLARMRFVHRDLAARNVLVNENLVCKVADFGLTRELEESCQGEYVTQGGKIPVRWTAPEAYKHRRFTTASDVWSYGILLWEIMSFADRPYGNWDNYMVMEQVNTNYRLTAPTNCPKIVHQLMMECWKADRTQRPSFSDIVDMLDRWIKSPYLLKDYEYVTEKVLMTDRKSCVAHSICEYLQGIKMERYIDNFIDFGYTELYQIQQMSDSDLIGIGVPLVGHRNKIIKSLSLRSERERLLPTTV